MLKKIFKRVNNKAFTIIEILLAVALLAIAAVAIGAVIISTQNNTAQMFSDTELQQQLVEVQENLHNEILGTNAGIKCWTKASGGNSWTLTTKNGGGDVDAIVAFYNLDMTDYRLTKTYYKYDSTQKTLVVGHGTPETVNTTTKTNCGLCGTTLSATTNKCPGCGATIIETVQHTVDPDLDIALSDVNNWSLVAANVEHFLFNVEAYDSSKLISYEIKLESAHAVYPADETVYMRNKITVNNDLLEIEKYHHMQIEIPSIQPVSFGYDGKVHGPTEVNFLSRFVERAEGTTLTATDCGTYKIIYRLKDKSATTWTDGTTADKVYTWTISKKIVQLEWGETEWDYDGQTHSTTCKISGLVAGSDCEVILTNNSIGPNVGEVTCTATLSNPNYGVPSISSVVLRIKPITSHVVIATSNKTYIDPGVSQSMVTYSDLTGGALKFYISKVNNGDPTAENVKETSATAVDAGTYHIWYRIVSDNANYSSTGVKYLGEAIMHRSPTASFTSENFTYDGDWHTGVIGIGAKVDPTHTAKNAGTYTATITPDSNHIWPSGDPAEPRTHTWTIYKASGIANPPTAAENLVYNGEMQLLLSEHGIAEYGYMEYKLGENGTWTTEIPQALDAGDYTIYYKSMGDSNHLATDGTDYITVTIARAREAFVIKTNRTFTGAYQLGYEDFDKVTIDGDYRAKESGTYTFYAEPHANYAWSDGTYAQKEFSWTINKATVVFTAPTAIQPTFTGSSLALVTTGSTSDGVILYSTDNSTWTSTVPYGLNATTYTVYYKLEADSNHLSISPTKISNVLIKPSPTAFARPLNPHYNGETQDGVIGLHVIWDGPTTARNIGQYEVYATLEKNYTWAPESGLSNATEKIVWRIDKGVGYVEGIDAVNPEYDGLWHDVVFAEIDSSGPVEYSWNTSGPWSTEIPQKKDAGTWTLYYRAQETDYYSRSEIYEIQVSVVLNRLAYILPQDIVYYNGTEHNGYFDCRYVDLTGESSGSYLGVYNYAATPSPGYAWEDGTIDTVYITWEIARNPCANYDAESKQYSGNPVTGVTYSHCEIVSGVVSGTAVGSYSVSLVPAYGYAWSNGSIAEIPVEWSITPAPASVVTAPSPLSPTYNKSSQALCTAGSCSGGTMQYKIGSDGEWSESIPTGFNAGKYTIYYRVVGDSNHTTIGGTQYITATIEQAQCTVTVAPEGQTHTYSGGDKSLISAGTASEGGSMYYMVESSTGSLIQDWTADLTLIVAKESDDYVVYYQARANDSNYISSEIGSTTAIIEGYIFKTSHRAWVHGYCETCGDATYVTTTESNARNHKRSGNKLNSSYEYYFNIKTIYKSSSKTFSTLDGPVAGYAFLSTGHFNRITASGGTSSGSGQGFVPSENCYVKPNYE